MFRLPLLLLCFCISSAVYSQERLTGLSSNPVVQAGTGDLQRLRSISQANDTLPVTLPFFDDFSADDIFPATDRWSDRYTFQNTDFPVYPINIGAITFDAVNDSGRLYSNAIPGPATFIADYLTSRYIRLDSVFSPVAKSLSPADSIVLSFYYQPQGRGRSPETSDSLTLQFLVEPAHDSISPTDTVHIPDRWQEVWQVKGMALDTFVLNNGKYFIQVLIPITEQHYFTDHFRFRFYNLVSLASTSEPSWQSNCDQWNLDNIYLNLGRSVFDTVYSEIRFIERPPSLLWRYESMPYPQYTNDPTGELKDTLNILISNRDPATRDCHYYYQLSSPDGSFLKTYDGGDQGIKPFYTNGYVTYQPFAHPPVPYLYPLYQRDSATFLMRHVILENIPGSTLGDTIEAWQRFYNYFAYDDGTPEAAYGLTPATSKLAYRFHLNKSPDTLRAISMYFNRTLGGNNIQYFYLCVWNDNAGKPGDTVYSELVMPAFSDSLNEFVTYHLTRPVKLTGTFYVGWIQTTSDNLNVGFDRYNDQHENVLYNVTGEWVESSYSGCLMIRPVVGKPIPVGASEPENISPGLTVYPNPACAGTVHVKVSGAEGMDLSSIEILNLYGQRMLIGPMTEAIHISGLSPGMYIIRLLDHSGRHLAATRLMITR